MPAYSKKDDSGFTYEYDGVKKQAVSKVLNNGMKLIVTAPVSEINGNWRNMVYGMLILLVLILLFFVYLTRCVWQNI